MNKNVTVVSQVNPRDYTYEGHVERVKYVGQSGVIIAEHNSHGLCYDVKFNGGIATYDPDELIFS